MEDLRVYDREEGFIIPFIRPNNYDKIRLPQDIIIEPPSQLLEEIKQELEISTSTKLEDAGVVMKDIDISKLQDRTSRSKNVYTLREIKDFAKRLGINHRQNKEDLIKAIKKMININT